MSSYQLSPYVHFIEDHLSSVIQYGVVHRLTGEVYKLSEQLRSFLLSIESEGRLLSEQELNANPFGDQLLRFRDAHFLISAQADLLKPFANYYLVRPIQNPAIAYRSRSDEVAIAHTSMEYYLFSPAPGEVPKIIEEVLSPDDAELFLLADGKRTVNELEQMFERDRFRRCLDNLTSPSRQLVKVAAPGRPLEHPYQPHNSVPRSLFHSAKWSPSINRGSDQTITEFHRTGIENAAWEFDWIEPTLNHSYRFASEVLHGHDYPSQFCLSALDEAVVPLVAARKELSVLEVGGGTGTFALGFIKQAKAGKDTNPSLPDLKYHIVELSPELIRSQQTLLQSSSHEVTHFHQDAVSFNLADHTFDLIVSNEVIADLPTATARRTRSAAGQQWEGEGGAYVEEYDLPVTDAPDSFEVHKGVFDFMKRCWAHLVPGGTVIMTEYAAKKYPKLMSHLSHDEWSIQFDQLTACAKKIGFESKLIGLKEFLGVDDEVLMLNGSAEQIFCLNYVLNKFGASLPYAAISKKEFETRFGDVLERAQLVGVTYSPLKTGFHYGPDPNQFKALILQKQSVPPAVAGGYEVSRI